jgi:hypothetical protein
MPPKIKTNETTFYLPKIVPGTYSEDDYGRYIANFKAYDAKGKEKGRFSINSNDKFKNVNGTTIYIIKGRFIIAYEVNGKEISRRSM